MIVGVPAEPCQYPGLDIRQLSAAGSNRECESGNTPFRAASVSGSTCAPSFRDLHPAGVSCDTARPGKLCQSFSALPLSTVLSLATRMDSSGGASVCVPKHYSSPAGAEVAPATQGAASVED